MVDAEFDRATQQSECGGTVVMETFELHRAETDARDGAVGEPAGTTRAWEAARSGADSADRHGCAPVL
jgi:hypothetical protein